MIDRRPLTELTGEFRLAQLAAERHPEASLPDLPEAYGMRYPQRRLPHRAEVSPRGDGPAGS